MKLAIKNQELLGLEPFYILKDILDRQQSHGWGILNIFKFYHFYSNTIDHLISGGQIFEEPTLQFIECKQLDSNNLSNATPHEQLISTAKFNPKGTSRFFIDFNFECFSLFSSRTYFQRILFAYIS